MKKIKFLSVEIKNFLSVGSEGIFLELKDGVNLITGSNNDSGGRNGVGKSSVIESIFWCLFGSTIRDIKKDKIIHNQSNKNCLVTLKFDIESNNTVKKYKLIRSLEPTKVTLIENDEDITLSTIPKTDELVKQLIGGTEEVFQNAVIMSANNTMPFMAQKKIDKRKFVEGILNLGIFSEMLLKARSHYNEYKKENDVLASTFGTQNRNLTLYKDQIEKNKEIKKQKITGLQNRIAENKNKIDFYLNNNDIEIKIKDKEDLVDKKKESILKMESGLEKIENSFEQLFKKQLESDFEVKNLKESISSVEKKTGICPICKRKYDSDDVCVDINDLKSKLTTSLDKNKEINKEISDLNSKKTTIKSGIASSKAEIEKYNKEIQQLLFDSKEIGHLKTRNEELLKEIEEINDSKDNITEIIENIEKEIEETEEKIQKLQKQLLILETSKFVVSEEGVKTFIVNKILSILNSKLNFYLKTLDAPCTCKFDETFEETIYNTQGKECSYFNFSGGERKRIDIAILFMFQDILRMQTGVFFNLSMYDELFDSALDEKGVNKIMEMLKERCEKHGESIYIVSHNKAATNTSFNSIIQLEKNNGTTRIVP